MDVLWLTGRMGKRISKSSIAVPTTGTPRIPLYIFNIKNTSHEFPAADIFVNVHIEARNDDKPGPKHFLVSIQKTY